MAHHRQDAWTQTEDACLVEMTLRHIRDGSTQLAAFAEAGQRLNRTASACGFRWNSLLRKQYARELEEVKRQRKEQVASARKKKGQREEEERLPKLERTVDTAAGWSEVLLFLQQERERQIGLQQEVLLLRESLREAERQVQQLKRTNQSLSSSFTKLESAYQAMENDYRTVLRVMEQAGRIAQQSSLEPGEEQI